MKESSASEPQALWLDAARVIDMLAVAPSLLGGVQLKAGPGPVRDAWLQQLRQTLPDGVPWRKIPAHISENRLLGGLDLAATLQAGTPVAERGLLAQCDGGIALLAMAERSKRIVDAHLSAVLDRGEVNVAREGFTATVSASLALIALDEGVEEDEQTSSSLRDRLALHVDLRAIGIRDTDEVATQHERITSARAKLHRVRCESRYLQALCAAAFALGIESLRAPLQAATVAKVAASLEGRSEVDDSDIDIAVRLVLAPRATRLPQLENEESVVEPEPPDAASRDQSDGNGSANEAAKQAMEDRLIEAAVAAIPPDLLSRLGHQRALVRGRSTAGKSGAQRRSFNRGRPMGSVPGDPRAGARLNLIATLRAAAPWQRLRRQDSGKVDEPVEQLIVLREDFRVMRYRERSQTTTIFLVDASGSAALNRLAEAKGAVELLLAECYIRRDQVALIAFRGEQAEILLPPTRSLVRAKRNLAALPGGGGTPLASAIEAAVVMATPLERRGGTVAVVLLTDGRGNIGRDGSRGKAAAQPDLEAAALQFRATGLQGVLVDTSPRPHAAAETLAKSLGVHYLPMPHAEAAQLRDAVTLVASA
ncbi:MAG: magnesium chelatase subunit D [Pseudomonadota bacterium]